MSDKTRMIVKDDQVMVDVDLIFSQIEEANGDWKKVRDSYRDLKNAIPEDLE